VSVDLVGRATVWERTLAGATDSHKEQKGTWISSQGSALMSFETIVSFIQYLDSGMSCPVLLMSSFALFLPVVRSLGAPQPHVKKHFSPAPVGVHRRADRLQGEVAVLLLRPRVAGRLFERADE